MPSVLEGSCAGTGGDGWNGSVTTMDQDKIRSTGKGAKRVRRRNLFRDIAKVGGRVDALEARVGDLETTTTEDAETLRLQQQGVTLLKRLAENHEVRIARNEQAIARIRRRLAARQGR